MQEIFTLEECAERLKAAPYTVRKWLRQGKLTGSRTPVGWRITAEDIQRFLDSYRQVPDSQRPAKQVETTP